MTAEAAPSSFLFLWIVIKLFLICQMFFRMVFLSKRKGSLRCLFFALCLLDHCQVFRQLLLSSDDPHRVSVGSVVAEPPICPGDPLRASLADRPHRMGQLLVVRFRRAVRAGADVRKRQRNPQKRTIFSIADYSLHENAQHPKIPGFVSVSERLAVEACRICVKYFLYLLYLF